MKLVDMKRPKGKKKNTGPMVEPYDGERYPYGLQIRLGSDEIEKLSMADGVDVGDTVTVTARARVMSKRAEKMSDGSMSKNIELQIESMGMDSDSADEKAFDAGAKK